MKITCHNCNTKITYGKRSLIGQCRECHYLYVDLEINKSDLTKIEKVLGKEIKFYVNKYTYRDPFCFRMAHGLFEALQLIRKERNNGNI